MASIAASDRTRQVADTLVKIEAALQDVFSYYKFGRYVDRQFEKPYFLLSHCSHLMFSLWLADQESEGAIFAETHAPVAFSAGPDFNGLRYAEYSRRMLHTGTIEEHLKNEPKWFRFWIEVLEGLDSAGDKCFEGFSQFVQWHVERQTFLERKMGHKVRGRLRDLMQEEATGRLLLRSVCVLEDLARAITDYLTTLDPKVHAVEQIAAILCLLGRMRRTIVCETPAKGPCMASDARHWRMPLSLIRLRGGRSPGVLTVVPKRDGGTIVCRYDRASHSTLKNHLWMRKVSTLQRPYEETLFKTWSYQTGDHLRSRAAGSESKACWTLQAEETAYLESRSREIDALLSTLRHNRACHNLIEAVRGVARHQGSQWTPGEIPWTYVERMDRVAKKLRFVCREAQVLGGDSPAEWAIRKAWPSAGALADSQDPCEQTLDVAAASDSIPASSI